MGRTRVAPESRQRSQRACNFCRSSKKKCDGVLPCSNCKRRGRQASCNFVQFLTDEQVRGPPPPPLPPSRASADTDGGNPQPSTSLTETVVASSSMPTTSYPTPDTERDTSSCGQQMQPRMLRNGAGGERVYIGSSAAISFLQFVRVTLRRCAGPSAFTESRTRHMLLEASVGAGNVCEFDDDLDPQTKASLVKSFLQASSGFLGLFTDEDIAQLLNETIEVPNSPRPSGTTTLWSQAGKRTALYLMLAIGARCRGSAEQDRRCSAMYFARAQEMAFRDMLLDPSLDMAISFLLMAFYMFCASRRNTALLYLGISSKAATILGLHSSELNTGMPRDVMDFRARIWASLRVLDFHGNGILGRPSSTDLIGVPSTADAEGAETKTAAHRILALKANFELCSIVEVISKALTKNNTLLDEVAAEAYLKMLRDWAQALPEELRRSIRKERHEDVPEWIHREHTIGNIHVACSYYFAVIIATRPFLVATVLPRLQKQQSTASRMASPSPAPSGAGGTTPGSRSGPVEPPTGNIRRKVQELSQTCVEGAAFLVQMCHDAITRDILLPNMCILQSWVFGGGVVLGFSLLAPPDHGANTKQELKKSFINSRNVLAKLSKSSPQSQRYYDILAHFSDAVEAYEKQQRRARRQSSSPYVEQILRPETDSDDASCPSSPDTSGPGPGEPSITVMSPADNNMEGQRATPGGTATPGLTSPAEQPGSMEGFLWSDQQANAQFTAEINDDLGLQLPWDEYAAGFMQGFVPTPAGVFPQVPWTQFNND